MFCAQRRHLGSLLAAFVFASGSTVRAQSTWYVDDDAPAGGDGKAWATSFTFLQDALGAAADGDTIEIAGGTYLPDHGAGHVIGSQTETFAVGPGTTLRGGYRGLAAGGSPDDRDPVAFPTLLTGDLANNDPITTDNSQHVVTTGAIGPACVFDGLQIGHGFTEAFAGGAAVLDSGEGFTATQCNFTDCLAWHGGAIQSSSATLELDGCSLLRNLAVLDGGAVNVQGATLNLNGCELSDNVDPGSFLEGGAVWASSSTVTIAGCTFERNTADHGGAVAVDKSTLTVTGSTFNSQRTSFDGAGLWISNSTATVDDSSFDSNHDDHLGGAIYAWRQSTVTASRCQFTHNHSEDGGAAVGDLPATVSFIDCLFDGNDAGNQSSGVDGGVVDLIRCTFQNNTSIGRATVSLGPGNGVNTRVFDCLFQRNTTTESTIFVSYSSGTIDFERCTVADNSAGNGLCGGIEVDFVDTVQVVVAGCILWNNKAFGGSRERHQIYGPVAKLDVDWCCIDGWSGRLGGTGNHGNDPLFVDEVNGDYSLQAASPCVEGGDPTFDAPAGFTRDVLGDCRLIDAQLDRSAVVDQGAFEFTNIRLDLIGSPTPGGTATLVSSGTAGLPLAMLIGLAPAEIAAPHFGTLFLDPGAICLCIPWPSAPSQVDVQVPSDAPLGPIYLQEFAMSGAAGNLSNGIVFDIE